jgi:hypothetical protein
VSLLRAQESAANKFIQERFIPKLVAAGITTVVDIVRKPDENSPPGAAIVKKADEIDAAAIVVVPHEHEFVEVWTPCLALFATGYCASCEVGARTRNFLTRKSGRAGIVTGKE